MQKNEYQNIFLSEDSHWFYLTTHTLVISLIKKNLSKKKFKNRILDAGCGTGLLVERMQSFGEIHGIDISSEAIKFSKKRGLRNIHQGSVTKLPFKKNFFDLIVSIDVLYHKWVTDDSLALKEFNRVLKPGGVLILKLPAFSWLARKHDQVVYTKKRYSIKELEKLISLTNFKIIKGSYFFFLLLPFVFMERLFKKRRVRSSIGYVSPFLNQILIYIMKFELMLFSNFDLPIGVSVVIVAKKARN